MGVRLTGEAGDVVLHLTMQGLWTDTRYFIQAVEQLAGTGVELHKTRIPGEVRIPEWLAEVAFPDRQGSVTIAVDGLAQTVASVDAIRAAFRHVGRHPDDGIDRDKSFRIVDMPDVLEFLWNDRPFVPVHSGDYIGRGHNWRTRNSRIEWLRYFIDGKDCDAILITALDEIAWLLNVRASDVEYNLS